MKQIGKERTQTYVRHRTLYGFPPPLYGKYQLPFRGGVSDNCPTIDNLPGRHRSRSPTIFGDNPNPGVQCPSSAPAHLWISKTHSTQVRLRKCRHELNYWSTEYPKSKPTPQCKACWRKQALRGSRVRLCLNVAHQRYRGSREFPRRRGLAGHAHMPTRGGRPWGARGISRSFRGHFWGNF